MTDYIFFLIEQYLRFYITIFIIISIAHSSFIQHGNGYPWTSMHLKLVTVQLKCIIKIWEYATQGP